MVLVQIKRPNGSWLTLYHYNISKYKNTHQKIDGDGTKRNLAGTMRRQVIANKIKLEFSTKEPISEEEVRDILICLKQDVFEVKYHTALKEELMFMKNYAGPPTEEIDDIYVKADGTEEVLYKALPISIIEL